MKANKTILTAAIILAFGPSLGAQTIVWGVPSGEVVIDSAGIPVDGASYKFELGAFALDYNPEVPNVGDWLTHWRVFDVLPGTTNFLNTENSVTIITGVESGSSHPSVATGFSFAGLKAYVWVRKGDDPNPSSEWFLGRSVGWEFPTEVPVGQIQWPLTDLGPGETPAWGRQNNVSGPGEFTFSGSLTGIQTYGVIPEPSAVFLAFVAGAGCLLRRKRMR